MDITPRSVSQVEHSEEVTQWLVVQQIDLPELQPSSGRPLRRRQRCPHQLEQVVGGVHQGPLPVHLLQAPQPEAIQSTFSFEKAKHSFHDCPAHGVDRPAWLGAETAVHQASCVEVFRPPAPQWPGLLAVLLPAGGDVGIQVPVLTGLKVVTATESHVRREHRWQLAAVDLDSLQHQQQVHGVGGLDVNADGHYDLMVGINCGLGIVALNTAIASLEDVAAGVGEIPLGLGLGLPAASVGSWRCGSAM